MHQARANCSCQYKKASADTKSNATTKRKRITESATHSISPLNAPEFQFYLTMHTKVKTMFGMGF